MPQRYKVRLGDGTVVSVDLDGLRTWAGDGRAVAQVVGTQAWRPLQDVLAEEETAARLARALVPPKPRQQATPTPPPRAPVAPPLELPEFDLGAEPSEPLPVRPSLQALADDPMPSHAPDPAAFAAQEDLPVIPMKPLGDEPAFRSAWSDDREEEMEDEPVDDRPRQDRLDGPLLTVLETGGGFLSRVLSRLTPLANRLTARRADDSGSYDSDDEDLPRRGVSTPAAAPAVLTLAEDPGSSPGDDDYEEDEQEDDRPTLLARVSGWLSGLTARWRRPAHEEEYAEPDEDEEPEAAWSPPPRTSPAPTARHPVAAPTPLSELPALRLAPSREPREREDVYGDRPRARFLNLEPLWDWTKRLVTTGALVAALAYAVLERDVWLPRTAELGQTVFTQIDRQVLSRKRSEEQRLALAAASQKLPELAPETITLVFSRSPTGTADAGEVFQVAREAADRGMGALPEPEAQELRELARELLATLSRTEAERVREYDRTRTRRVIFPFENPHVMDRVARGARALPAERLARLRELSHKAVAAGLALPEVTPAPGALR